MSVTVAVKVLHGNLLDPGEGIFVSEFLVDDRAAANVAQLGAKEGVAASILPLLELDHDPELPLPLDRHAVLEITGVDHARWILPVNPLANPTGSPTRPAGAALRFGQRWHSEAAGDAGPCSATLPPPARRTPARCRQTPRSGFICLENIGGPGSGRSPSSASTR